MIIMIVLENNSIKVTICHLFQPFYKLIDQLNFFQQNAEKENLTSKSGFDADANLKRACLETK